MVCTCGPPYKADSLFFLNLDTSYKSFILYLRNFDPLIRRTASYTDCTEERSIDFHEEALWKMEANSSIATIDVYIL